MVDDQNGVSDGPRVQPVDAQSATIWSLVFVAVAALCWVGFALMVAEPTQFMKLRFVELAADFARFKEGPSEALTVLVLLAADVTIAVLFLADEDALSGFTGRRRLGVTAVAALVFVVAALYLPLASPAFSASAAAVGLVAMLALVVLRGMSYAPPLRVSKVKRPLQPVAPEGPPSSGRKEP